MVAARNEFLQSSLRNILAFSAWLDCVYDSLLIKLIQCHRKQIPHASTLRNLLPLITTKCISNRFINALSSNCTSQQTWSKNFDIEMCVRQKNVCPWPTLKDVYILVPKPVNMFLYMMTKRTLQRWLRFKCFELGRLPWIIRWTQPNHLSP